VVRVDPADGVDDLRLGAAVDVGDEVVAALGRDLERLEPVQAAEDDVAGATCRADADVDERVAARERADSELGF